MQRVCGEALGLPELHFATYLLLLCRLKQNQALLFVIESCLFCELAALPARGSLSLGTMA